VPGHLRPEDLLNHVQQPFRSPQVGQRLAEYATDVEQYGRAGKLPFQIRQTRFKTVTLVTIPDLPRVVKPVCQVVDALIDPCDHRRKLRGSEKVTDDQETILFKLLELRAG
jgi:hypothetical protein